MRAGTLDREITLQHPVSAISFNGTPVIAWSTYATLRAQRIEATTDEYIRGYGASTENIMVFRTRYIDGVTGADQILFEDEPYVIKQIKEIGRRIALEFRAERLGP